MLSTLLNSGDTERMGQYHKGYSLVIVFSICLILLSTCPAFAEQIILDSSSQFDFARTLMEKGAYAKAVSEFERFIYFFPNDRRVPKAKSFIGICYLKDKRFDTARDVFFQILSSERESIFAVKALLLIGESYYQQGILTEAEHYFMQVIEKYPHLDLKSAALYRLGWTLMQAGRWREASEIFSKVGKDSPFYEGSQELVEQSLKGEGLHLKSPACAGTLAALIPGMGHVYVGRYRDATVAFILNGLFIWAAVESFNENHDVLGGILTFVELGWYAGNIYSAVNCAHKYNSRVKDNFRNSFKDQFDLHLFAAKQGHVGLAMTFRF